MGRRIEEVQEELLRDPEVRREYEALEEEFAVASALIAARARAGLTQQEVAHRMGTTQSAVARLESGRPLPSLRSLMRYAAATGSRLDLKFVDR